MEGIECMDVKDYTIFYSSVDNHTLGTGFMVRRDMKQSVIDFKPTDIQMCILRSEQVAFSISIMCVYTPPEEIEDDIKEMFYDKLE